MSKELDIIKNNKSAALLAPSFVIDFKYPAIIGALKKLGFESVAEITFGARMVNRAYVQYVKKHPKQELFISSPCPTVVTFIQNRYPDFAKFLMPVVSPMASMAKIYKKQHPDQKVIFIAPCFAKKNIEAPKYKELIDGVLTFKELKRIFEQEGIKEEDFKKKYRFDSLVSEYTKIYPVSGGLAATSHVSKLFKDGEILITDGVDNIKKALEDLKAGKSKYRFLDLLNCSGGCIGGPAISSNLSIKGREEVIKAYTGKSSALSLGRRRGKLSHAKGVDFDASFQDWSCVIMFGKDQPKGDRPE